VRNITTVVYEASRTRSSRASIPLGEPAQQELAKEYGASRNSVKKALLMLEKENLVVLQHNKGAKVRSYSMDEVLEFLSCAAAWRVHRPEGGPRHQRSPDRRDGAHPDGDEGTLRGP
jgi:DNA-binding transcriptional MocR family regulator